MGLDATYQAPRASDPHPVHRIYPYLLKVVAISMDGRGVSVRPDRSAIDR